MRKLGFLVLESGECYSGIWHGGLDSAGEVVFNTGHSGYEEMATDPSYHHQILITTAPMQGNYGEDDAFWESKNIWIKGFICLEIQSSHRDASWLKKLTTNNIPVVTDLDTREIVITLREKGTTWGALVQADSAKEAKGKASQLISEVQKKDKDWVSQVTCKEAYQLKGEKADGPKVAVLDFGCKENTLRELVTRCSKVGVFPSKTSSDQIREFAPDGILLSNGPGDPDDVVGAVETVQSLLGEKYIFGICMGHHILSQALGAKTYKLKFGHRGGNHPVKDKILSKIYMTSQNHGYAVDMDSLPEGVQVTHVNLNDDTVSGIRCESKNCMSVQFHPESHPGPHDSEGLFDYFVEQIQ